MIFDIDTLKGVLMFFFIYDNKNEVEPSLDETQLIFEAIKQYKQEFWYASYKRCKGGLYYEFF